MKKLVILDRDGVINRDRIDSVKSISEFVFYPDVPQAINRLNQAGLKVAVATNQSIVGRGIITQEELDAIHTHMIQELGKANAKIDAIFMATDHPDQASARRKPGAGMLLEALAQFGVSADESVVIGDSLRDLEAAKKAGIDRILVQTGKGKALAAEGLPPALEPVLVMMNLSMAVRFLLNS
ncbi:MAG: D-glycero-alpha-D-manno-heptose-1,7-bisphosphate 7-phosphatase [Dongiaceae bacterium]